MTALELLKSGRDFLSDKDRWTMGSLVAPTLDDGPAVLSWDSFIERRAIARRILNGEVRGTVKCCALGYLKVLDGPNEDEATAYLRQAAREIASGSAPLPAYLDEPIVYVNDYLGYSYVLAMYDLAIELATKEPRTPKIRMATYDGYLIPPLLTSPPLDS